MNEGPVRIEERLVSRIDVREFGLPTLLVPGKIWRSEKYSTITCVLNSKDPNKVSFDTRLLEVIPVGKLSELPDSWRDAIWGYVQEWPHSGCKYGPFLHITEQERCDFIRKLAAKLCGADNIGARSMADSIGKFAAWEYELAELKEESV